MISALQDRRRVGMETQCGQSSAVGDKVYASREIARLDTWLTQANIAVTKCVEVYRHSAPVRCTTHATLSKVAITAYNMEEPQIAPEAPVATFRKRNAKPKSNIRKREAIPPPASDSDSGFTSSEDEQGRQIKRRRKNVGVTASSTTPTTRNIIKDVASTDAAVVATNKDDATKTSNWYDEDRGKTKTHKETTKGDDDDASANNAYKGQAGYSSFIQKNPDREGKTVGPVKSSSNVRTITVTDFAPDVCKDYKQTGFCGFGDSCKFLHAREDYAQGWQLDREWEINGKSKKASKTSAPAKDGKDGEDDEEKRLESIPFKCIICKDDYKNPIITKCGHYFCEACALKRYRKNPSCAACASGTGGVFNVAKKLNELLERKRVREDEKSAEIEQGADGG